MSLRQPAQISFFPNSDALAGPRETHPQFRAAGAKDKISHRRAGRSLAVGAGFFQVPGGSPEEIVDRNEPQKV